MMWPFKREPDPIVPFVPPPHPVLRPVWAACPATMYEPGASHEHHCLAKQAHPGLDHTCGARIRRDPEELCCKTWPDVHQTDDAGLTAQSGAPLTRTEE